MAICQISSLKIINHQMIKVIKEPKIRIMLILSMLLLFHGFNNYYILTRSRYSLAPDSMHFLKRSDKICQILKDTRLDPGSIYSAYDKIYEDDFKPPLFFVTGSPFFLFTFDKNIAAMSNLIYMAILLFSTYGIGKKLYGYKTGLLSAFLVSMFPTVFALSRIFLVDFALASMVALTFYLFILNRFQSLKFSLLTGVVIGLGSLVKQSYFIFLLPILLYFFSSRDNFANKEVLRGFFLAIIVGLALSVSYYSRNSYDYYHFAFQITNYSSPYFYFDTLLNRQLLPFFSVLFLIALPFSFRKNTIFLPIMIFAILIVFSLSPNKSDRFILPIFPYVAVIISGFMLSLKGAKKPLVAALFFISFFQYFMVCYGKTLPQLHNITKKVFSDTLDKDFTENRGLFSIVDEGDWQSESEKIIKIVSGSKAKIGKTLRVLPIVQEWRIATSLEYLAKNKKLKVEFEKVTTNSDFKFRPRIIDKDFNNKMELLDFIIVQEIAPQEMWLHTRCLLAAFEGNLGKFELVDTVKFPGQLFCRIYRNCQTI